jgi:feruloyl-CoA synthase
MAERVLTEVFAPPHITAEPRADGTIIMRSVDEPAEHGRSMAHVFRAGAAAHPERTLAAERAGDRWRTLAWGEARARSDAVAEALLQHGLGPDRPLMILSGNSLEHLTLLLAAYAAGVPVVPVSTAYSLLSRDHARVRAIAELCAPGIVFADDGEAYGTALSAAAERGAAVRVVARNAPAGALLLDELLAGTPGARLERAFAAIGPETTAKILFTSGSTATPKGVINTHRMMCSNATALGRVWRFLEAEPPVLVDWLPWSHTFGSNFNLGQILTFGGTLYIDDGKPTPALFERTVSALREVPPTAYYNVPAGYALLAPRLEGDPEFAATFFSRLRLMFYAAAALPQALWDRMGAIAAEHADHPVPLTAAWGTTETAPCVTAAHFTSATCGCIGVPIPGVTVKLVPFEDKLDIRVAGPNITPGYVGNPEATEAAFDEEGFYTAGDAVRFVDPDDPAKGLMFDGRLAENFKLATGTWVIVGQLRTALISEARVLSDAVIAGHDREFAAAIAWLNQPEAQRICGTDDEVAPDHPALARHLAACLSRLNENAGSAARIERLLLDGQPPNMDAGEITDKSYINQRAVLEGRADAVDRLFAEPLADGVITPSC